jgi:hypothetical protein
MSSPQPVPLVPPWTRRAPDPADEQELAQMTPDERLEHFVEACELAAAILRERADVEAVLARRDPLSPEAEARWRALVGAARARPAR